MAVAGTLGRTVSLPGDPEDEGEGPGIFVRRHHDRQPHAPATDRS